MLPLDSEHAGHKYELLFDGVRALILDGRIAVGTRLPSERDLAAAAALSRSTVTAGYDALRDDGYLESRPGAGSFATLPASTVSSRQLVVPGGPQAEIDLTVAALPAPSAAVLDAVTAATAALPAHLRDGGYDPVGLPVLRAAVAERFASRGVPTDPDQILITGGALHALDLLLRLLVAPGDRVMTELPTYAGALDAVRLSGARLLPVPVPPGGGWDVAQMTALLRQTAPRMAYLIPDFQNPVGALVSDQSREQVIAAARATSTTLVVDETFVGLGFVPDATPAASFDPDVVTIGSLSKSVWGGLRVGWVRGPLELIRRLASLRTTIDLGGPVLDQLVAAELLPGLDAVLAERVSELEVKRDALAWELALSLPEWRFRAPDGGLALWVELDAPLSTSLTLLARSAGVVLVPGSRFGVDGTLERFLRIPFGADPELLTEAVRRLAAVWHDLDRQAAEPRQLLVA